MYSSFLLFAQRAGDKYGVSSRDLLVELGRRKTIGGRDKGYTLATSVFEVGPVAVLWRIYDHPAQPPVAEGRQPV